uniref:Cathepsin propeptide inhibitor domain-containing protein n=1 Tax=Oryza punctata TaxID=4537 RepID=A0A0E0LN72_ORYPU
MSLRALASLLTRRLSARGAQAPRSAAAGTRPAPRALRTLVSLRFPQDLRSKISSLARSGSRSRPLSAQRDLGVGRGTVKGALALTSSLAGLLLGFLYFKQDRDDSAWEETRKEKEETVKWRDVIDPSVMANFTRKDGTFAYPDYFDYLRKCSDKEEAIVDDVANTDEEDNNVVDEAAMKSKFEDWMKEHDRRYITEKEKAHRYENFKKAVKGIDKLNIKRGMRSPLAAPTELADYTDEELQRLGILADESYWEEYLDHIHTAIARGYVFRVDDENVCEAVKKAMFLRALASLLARRLSARGAQAQRSAAAGTRPAAPRSLRTIRDLGVGHGAVKGALALASSLAGLLGFLYFKPDRDDSAEEETRKEEEVSVHWRDVMEPSVMARFTRKDGTFAYLDYIDYLNSQMNHGGKPLYDMKCSEKEEIIVDVAADTDEDGNNVVDEVAMKAKFEDWMKEHGRRYITEKEKAHRYENFKKVVNGINKFNAKRGMRGSLLAPLAPNELADYSEEELHGLGTLADESHWEGYLDHVHTMIARGNDIHHNENACEAVKKRFAASIDVRPLQMASRGRGRGRGRRGGGYGFDHPAKHTPHEDFPDITLPEMTCARATMEEKALIQSTLKFEDFWKTSCYHLEEDVPKKKNDDKEIERYSDRKRKTHSKREALASYLTLTPSNFPVELVQGSRRGQPSNKKLRWDRSSDDQAFEVFEKLEEKHKARASSLIFEDGDKKTEKDGDDEDEHEEEEVEEEENSDDDYNQNIEFDDDDDDWNQEEEAPYDQFIAMSLRALASLLTRRLSARGAQAPRSAAAGTRPAPRALRTLVSLRFPQDLRSKISSLARSGSRSRPLSAQRDLGVGRGTVKGALALTSSLAGLLLGFLYFKQDRDDSAWEETRKEKEETVKWRDVIDPSVMANFTRKDGTFAYPDYFDYLRKCSDKEEAIVDDVANTDEEDNNVVDEAAMKSKFEDWMKEHDRRYITEKEKAHRYENFKKAVKGIDKLNIKRGMRSPLAAPTELADYTDEELQRLGILADESYWEEYLDHIHTAIARGYVFRVDDENVCEAVKKAMFLRALASLLARRLSARGAQAQRSAAAGTRPAAPRSLRTIRDLGVGHGAVKGALALASSLAGLLGFLYFKPDRDDSAEEETRKEEEVSVHWRDVMEPSVMARFTRKDGTFAYLDYIDYLNSQMNHGGKPLYDMKCSEKEEIIVDVAADTDEDGNNVVDEVAMKAKFEDWMKEHGRRYITEKEKAHRYENFKKVVNGINKFNAKRGMRGSLLAPLAPNELADYSEEELHGLGTLADESHWEGYLDHVHTMIARGNDIHHNENACEAVKKRRRELFSMRDKAMRQSELQTNSS